MTKAFRTPDHKTVTVNGTEHNVVATSLSHEDVVQLASKAPQANTLGFTVTYKNGKAGGSLRPGQDVLVSAGMRFSAVRTNRA